jgi:hypothetical protein
MPCEERERYISFIQDELDNMEAAGRGDSEEDEEYIDSLLQALSEAEQGRGQFDLEDFDHGFGGEVIEGESSREEYILRLLDERDAAIEREDYYMHSLLQAAADEEEALYT